MFQDGKILGDFEILGRLGQGGMGAVYKARQVSLKRFVALKTLQASLASDPEYIARFHREAIAAAGLNHPNLVQVYAAGQNDGLHWFAMEYVEGESAQDRLKRKGRVEPAEAIAIAMNVATALDHGWRKAQLIHRDIKPDNIFLSSDGEVKLGDLGLAKSAGENQSLTTTGASMGTPHYVSPEQAEGKKDVDLRADIYSLGCTLYHMLTGQAPYSGDSAMSVMMKHITAPVPDIRKAWPECPPALAAVVTKTMQKSPAARQQTHAELSAELRRAYAALSAPPKKPNLPPAWIAGGVALLAAVAALLYFVPWKKGDGPTDAGRAEKAKSSPALQRAEPSATAGRPGGLKPPTTLPVATPAPATPKTIAATPAPATPAPPTPPAATPAPVASAPMQPANSTTTAAITPPSIPKPIVATPAPATPMPATPAPPRPTPVPALPAAQSVTGKWLAEQEAGWQATFAKEVTAPFEKGVGDLKRQYLAAVETQLAAAVKAAKLDDAVAFRAERERLTRGGEMPAEDEATAPASLKTLRASYRTAFAKLDTERFTRAKTTHARTDTRLAQNLALLTQSQRLDEALEIKARREALATAWLKPPAATAPAAPSATPATATPKAVPASRPSQANQGPLIRATKEHPFVNSLGMRFVPVPIVGGPTEKKEVLFCIWETRVQDYTLFVTETKRAWAPQDFKQGVTHPAGQVDWEDARAFCEWLTDTERRSGRLKANDTYRLPTDHEWSCAVGSNTREDPKLSPGSKNGVLHEFPWGKKWPPPHGSGNYRGEECVGTSPKSVIKGYRDDFQYTAPVGSYRANRFGLFDLGGNVWEWCEDFATTPEEGDHVRRGASYLISDQGPIWWSARGGREWERGASDGFRVVLAPVP